MDWKGVAKEIQDDFTDFVLDGVSNPAPYCGNKTKDCVDGRGWCRYQKETCRGFCSRVWKEAMLKLGREGEGVKR